MVQRTLFEGVEPEPSRRPTSGPRLAWVLKGSRGYVARKTTYVRLGFAGGAHVFGSTEDVNKAKRFGSRAAAHRFACRNHLEFTVDEIPVTLGD